LYQKLENTGVSSGNLGTVDGETTTFRIPQEEEHSWVSAICLRRCRCGTKVTKGRGQSGTIQILSVANSCADFVHQVQSASHKMPNSDGVLADRFPASLFFN
jgi:hypothetical protein